MLVVTRTTRAVLDQFSREDEIVVLLPSGERMLVGTPKKARKIKLDPSTNIQSAKET